MSISTNSTCRPGAPSIRVTAALSVALQVLVASSLSGQATGMIRGTVFSVRDGGPMEGVTVSIPSAALAVRTDAAGRFVMPRVPTGHHELVAERIGMAPGRASLEVEAGALATTDFHLTDTALLIPEVIVSATGEGRRLNETAVTVGVISADELLVAKPTHPSEVMDRIPGVWVNVTGGEGHMTAIRQPQNTRPVYLFLEDGIPTRSTGFFNHNALYEVNLPQAERIEVLKGPATALYGSDAIGGVINVETRRPTRHPSAEGYVEGGPFGYNRMLLSASNSWGPTGVRADLNLTRTDGWREATGYDRQSGTLRWDSFLGSRTSLRTVLTGSRIDQQTAGSSALPREEYLSQPRGNLTPISLRNVRTVRFSTAAEYTGDHTLLSVTPYFRWNEMKLLPNWSLTYDPTIYDTGHNSVGLLARGRRSVESLRTDLIAGMDVDFSPGGRTERRIMASRTGKVFTAYMLGDLIYDYDVTFRGASPYLQANVHPASNLHATVGVRYDALSYSYRSRLSALDTGRWRRPADADLTYRHLSPKFGLSYEVAHALNVYGNYAHGFRAPSEGQLFRQGSASNTLGLEPVTADSYELGARGEIPGRLGYSLAAYHMAVRNEIIGYIQPDGTPETQNAGETLHRGVEVGLRMVLGLGFRGDVSYSRAKHTYQRWSPRLGIEYGGNWMESAPGTLLNTRLTFVPGLSFITRWAVEWSRIGSFWLDVENTHQYEGHHLFNAEASFALPHDIEVIARVRNLLDARHAETAGYTAARGEELSPGMPRTLYLGGQFRWRR